jgi:glycosyltransferase involved in cell wall biosynthesis
VVRDVVVAVPGDLATPTGGFGYDRRITAELAALGWKTRVLDLGSGFPRPTAQLRSAAAKQLAAVPARSRIVVDGLAYGALPETAHMLRDTHRLIALVHHPLALETGLTADAAAALRASERAALECASHVIATGAVTMHILAQDFDVPIERLSLVEPGTDKMAAPRRQPGQELMLLSVGAVVPRKGYDVLACALGRVSDLPWRLVIVGDCTRSPETVRLLREEIMRLGLSERIVLRGSVSADELASLYAGSDIFVLASRFEGYGMAFAEAIAHGLPLVGTNVGAIAQAVPPEARVVVPVEDADALAAALRRLIENPAERAQLAGAAAAAVFPSWREQGARFARILESLA